MNRQKKVAPSLKYKEGKEVAHRNSRPDQKDDSGPRGVAAVQEMFQEAPAAVPGSSPGSSHRIKIL